MDMRKYVRPVLWSDVPDNLRIDRAFLLDCVGADPAQWSKALDPETRGGTWVEKKVRLLSDPHACAAAVRWGSSSQWGRCNLPVVPGQAFCVRHGQMMARCEDHGRENEQRA